MKAMRCILVTAVLCLAPAALLAQGGGGRGMGGRGGMMGAMSGRSPVAFVIDHKADLQLSDDQVAKLQDIEKKVEDKNKPLVEKMRQAWGGGERPDFQSMSDEDRQALREKIRPITQEIRDNDDAARQEANGVLTSEQKSKVEELMQQMRQQRRSGGGPGAER